VLKTQGYWRLHGIDSRGKPSRLPRRWAEKQGSTNQRLDSARQTGGGRRRRRPPMEGSTFIYKSSIRSEQHAAVSHLRSTGSGETYGRDVMGRHVISARRPPALPVPRLLTVDRAVVVFVDFGRSRASVESPVHAVGRQGSRDDACRIDDMAALLSLLRADPRQRMVLIAVPRKRRTT